MKNKQGFTLIELLVVIAIIAILAAILFPVFAKAREKARQTACLSNLKQIGLGFTQYEQDYDETPPCGVYLFGPGGSGWAGQIYSYVKSTNIYQCPDDTLGKGTFSSYAVNSNMGTGAAYPFSAFPISKYTAVAKTVLLFEVTGSVGGTAANPVSQYDITQPNEGPNGKFGGSPFGNGILSNNQPNGSGTNPCATRTLKFATGYLGQRDPTPGGFACEYLDPLGRHNDGSNFLMADCHAKWLRGSSVSSGSNPLNNDPTRNESINNYAAGTQGGKLLDATTDPAATFSVF